MTEPVNSTENVEAEDLLAKNVESLALCVPGPSLAVPSDKNAKYSEDASLEDKDNSNLAKEDPSTSNTESLPLEPQDCKEVTASPTISKEPEILQDNSTDSDPGPGDSVANDPNTADPSSQDSSDESPTEDEEPGNNEMYLTYPPHPEDDYMCHVSVIFEGFYFSLTIFWDDETSKVYDDMLVEIQDKAMKLSPLNETYLFQYKPCIAIYPEDGLWYRASVLRYSKAKGLIKVLYVDYGNIEVLPVADVREIKVKWIQLAPACMFAKLYGMRLNPDIEFSVLSKYYHEYILFKRSLQATIVSYDGMVPLIELKNENGDLVYRPFIEDNIFIPIRFLGAPRG